MVGAATTSHWTTDASSAPRSQSAATLFSPNAYSDVDIRDFRSRYTTLRPLPDGERVRSKEKHKSWVQLHKLFLERNTDLWGDRQPASTELYAIDPDDIPEHWDWREKGVLSGVWEQGACGGCWAFTTTTAMEGIHYIWTREKITLSPQMLLECDALDNDCAGGNMVTGFQFAVMKGGVAAEVNYNYNDYTRDTGAVGPCRENSARLHAVSIDDYIIIPNTWLDLKAAVLMQPVSVAVNGFSNAFRYYSSGILTLEQCQANFDGGGLVNHAVAAVGFGVDDAGLEYLIIKNSWGTGWGEGGFARISMEGVEMNATCGLLVESVAPLKYSNETYVDPKFDPAVDDYVDWAPSTKFGLDWLLNAGTVVLFLAVFSAGMLIVACMACADALCSAGDDNSVALINDGERDFFVYYGSHDGESYITSAERGSGGGRTR